MKRFEYTMYILATLMLANVACERKRDNSMDKLRIQEQNQRVDRLNQQINTLESDNRRLVDQVNQGGNSADVVAANEDIAVLEEQLRQKEKELEEAEKNGEGATPGETNTQEIEALKNQMIKDKQSLLIMLGDDMMDAEKNLNIYEEKIDLTTKQIEIVEGLGLPELTRLALDEAGNVDLMLEEETKVALKNKLEEVKKARAGISEASQNKMKSVSKLQAIKLIKDKAVALGGGSLFPYYQQPESESPGIGPFLEKEASQNARAKATVEIEGLRSEFESAQVNLMETLSIYKEKVNSAKRVILGGFETTLSNTNQKLAAQQAIVADLKARMTQVENDLKELGAMVADLEEDVQ